MTTTEEWLDAQCDRVLARQRARVDAAKLLATVALAVSATFTAAALQAHDGSPRTLDLWAGALVACATIFAVAVVLFDRIREPDHDAVLDRCARLRPGQGTELDYLRDAAEDAIGENAGVVRLVAGTLVAQLLVSAAASVLSVLSLTT